METQTQSNTEHMMSSTPNRAAFDIDTLAACLDACATCAIACRSCADACLGEQHVMSLRRCIRTNLDCAALCNAVIDVGSRTYETNANMLRELIDLCARVCGACAMECEKHADHHEHCSACAATCRACEAACRAVGA